MPLLQEIDLHRMDITKHSHHREKGNREHSSRHVPK